VSRSLRAINADLDAVRNRINDLYWTFTRTKRGKPPCVADPALHDRQRELLNERAAAIAAKRGARAHRR
jgi:hypothetical protein